VIYLALLIVLLFALPVRAQIAVSANHTTEILVDGVRVMVPDAPPGTVTLIDLSARPPRIIAELNAPSSWSGRPQMVAVTPDESVALLSSSLKVNPADPTTTQDNKMKNPSRPAGARAYVEDLEAWERQTGLKVSPGDALFVYNAPAPPGQRNRGGLGGSMDVSVLPWMKARGVSITSAIRSIPEDARVNHVVSLVAMGLHLLDGLRLDELAQTAARLNQWEFLLVIAPPNVPGSTGELVNPLAMF
jgi:hypothetical protein